MTRQITVGELTELLTTLPAGTQVEGAPAQFTAYRYDETVLAFNTENTSGSRDRDEVLTSPRSVMGKSVEGHKNDLRQVTARTKVAVVDGDYLAGSYVYGLVLLPGGKVGLASFLDPDRTEVNWD